MVDSSSDSWILDGTSRQNSLPPLEMFCKYENKIWAIYTQLTTDLVLHCELNRSTAHWLTISQTASVQQVLFQFNPGKSRQKHGDLVPGLFHCLGTLWKELTTSVLQRQVGQEEVFQLYMLFQNQMWEDLSLTEISHCHTQ